MSGLETKLALEAFKPASGVIKTLLKKKIERLETWIEDREVKGKLDPHILSVVMLRYLSKLSERVSEITSIAFPQLKLNIFDAYEPLSIRRFNYDFENEGKEYDISSLIGASKNTFVVIDNAGMGKSTFSKFIVARVLLESDRIPIFFELRKIDKKIDLVENLALEFDFPGNIFDRSLFYKLLEIGRFYVILDGFDEVQIEYQEELANQIHELSIKGGDNNLLLTSRPQDALPELVGSVSLRFVPFTVAQASSLLERYDSISNLDVGLRLIKEMDSVPERFIESPLLISLLYRTFGVNNTIADRVSTFYDEIYHALYKGHDLINKNGYSREKKSKLDFEDFRKLLRSLCYYMMLNRKTSFKNWSEAVSFIEKSATIASVKPSSSSNFLDDLFVAVPLMQRDGTEYKFFHKTILEYFAAEYLVLDKSSSELVEKIFLSRLAGSFDKTFEFMEDLNSSLFDSVITYYFAEKAPLIKNDENNFSLIVRTVFFLKVCKIGLWKTSDHSEVIEISGKEHVVLSPSHDEEDFDVFDSTAWRHGKINNEDYMLAINFEDKYDNLHPLAWAAISKDYECDHRGDINKQYDLDVFREAIGEGRWVDLDIGFLEEIPSDHPAFISLFTTVVENDSFDFGEGLRVLCREKIRDTIDKVKRNKEINVEMEDFFRF